jgi:hypothetical protein
LKEAIKMVLQANRELGWTKENGDSEVEKELKKIHWLRR